MNFSHGDYTYHQSVIDNARESETIFHGSPLAIALDTKGPEIRTGNTRDGIDYSIPANHQMIFTTNIEYKDLSDDKIMFIDYKNITQVLEPGRIIYVDDGILSFQVLDIIDDENLDVISLNAGNISSHKGVNLPGTDVDLPALSTKDKNDLLFGIKNEVDMIFASFIRTANDIREIRNVLGHEVREIKIIAKIESQQGVNNFDEIVKVADGIMVARGDLGIEIPAYEVFVVQKQLIAKCNISGKPVICATQMLESMTYNPRPTRAEVSDVGNAILDGADCVMLSGETAKGDYPIEAVQMMHETALEAEMAIAHLQYSQEIRDLTPRPTDTPETVAMSAVTASFEQDAKAIIVLSHTGETARLVAKHRPACPIILVTRNRKTARWCHLCRGVYPFEYTKEQPLSLGLWQQDVDERIKWAMDEATRLDIINRGDVLIAIQGWTKGIGHTNNLRVLEAF